MRVGSAIAAMRGDSTIMGGAQAVAIEAARQWRERPRIAPVLAELDEYGRGAPLASCPQLAELFGPGPSASAFAGSLSRSQCAALASESFAQVPFRHAHAQGMSTLLLARAGRAQLTLVGIEPGQYPARTVVLSDAARHEAVLAGEARAQRFALCRDGTFERDDLQLAEGARLTLDLGRQALVVATVAQRLVALRLARTDPDPAPSRQYDLATGELLHRASGDIRASRHEMMLALLGRMGRSEAAPVMADMAVEAGADSLRWQALREALALDTAIGFGALSDIARRPVDPLAMAAGALRSQLVEAHPQLAALEDARCRG